MRIHVDEENAAPEFWTAVQVMIEQAPEEIREWLGGCLPGDQIIVPDELAGAIRAWCESMPGWHGGPDYAPHPLRLDVRIINRMLAQCARCAFVGERDVVDDAGETTNPTTADECPSCGTFVVLNLACNGERHLICVRCWNAKNPRRRWHGKKPTVEIPARCCFCAGELGTRGAILYVSHTPGRYEPTHCPARAT